ncbi:MAG: PSD1 and planctomycete cytochrome C domain-containing protein [Verrucomicrobiales bacterium]|nr:PSD1 and planctomycete cytochrome C domain-containing protein [Verrucomicrobiales bacterium]
MLLLCAVSSGWVYSKEIRFNRDVRPILSDNCFYCHGPDEKTQEADLRLDTFEGATRDLGGYAAVVPGEPDTSELMIRVQDHDDLMPPPKSKKTLTGEQIDTLRAWISQGAKYEPHWSFLPLEKAPLPDVKQADWPNNPIDYYILSRLEAEGIKPSREAARTTLIRRLYIDLTGLLPDPDEVAGFVNNPDEGAYEYLVDSLLASPHYGERWGRHWLDQARYADSNGYSIDSLREMWPYRDWVIKALNDDMPFDQFTIEQLAGDLLPEPTKLQKIATGFHRNTLINQEGGSDREQFRVESAIDRVATTGAVWLGLTVGCAQCHTHKFDPITHREFYQLYAFFNSTSDQNSPGKTLDVARGEVFGKPVKAEKSLSDKERETLKANWIAAERERLKAVVGANAPAPVWISANATSVKTDSGKALQKLPGSTWLLPADRGPNDTIIVTTRSSLPEIRGIRLRVLPHESLPKNGPGTAGNGNFVLTRFEASVDGKQVGFSNATADHEQNGYAVINTINGSGKDGWAINSGKSGLPMNTAHEAIFTLNQPIESAGKEIEIRLHHDLNKNYLIGHFAIDFTGQTPPAPKDRSVALLSALEKPGSKLSKEEKELIESGFVAAVPQARPPEKNKEDLGSMLIMEELKTPRDTYLLTRGDFTRPDKDLGKLHPGGLSFVSPSLPAKEGRNRIDLARWLVHPENPLTPRVTMNRMWMRYFGRGLVETEEDFGTQGSLPSHPELLDWLGLTLIEKHWSMKAMHRLIVTSATYRQQSHSRADLSEIDPQNYLLARQSRNRFDAEIVRDSALCASGLMTGTIGGPGVYPPQPEGVYSFTQSKKKWNTSRGPDRYRRAMYTVFYRSAPYPLFTTFDSPDFSSVCTRRVKSNTPLQALNIANDPVFIELARALALRLAKEAPNDIESWINRAFQICLSRFPSAGESDVLQKYVASQQAAYSNDPDSAIKLATGALTEEVGKPEDAAALVSLARVMFNTDNFITRE